jgi:hypothetical protein
MRILPLGPGSGRRGPKLPPPSAPTRPGARRAAGSGGTLWEREALSEYFGAGRGRRQAAGGGHDAGIARGGADLSSRNLSSRTGVLARNALPRGIAARARAERRARAARPTGQAAAPGATENPSRGERTPAMARASLARPTVLPGEPRVYRYPTMYRAEAPPLLPPERDVSHLTRCSLAPLAGHLVLARRHRLQDAPGSGLRTVARSKPGDQLVVARRRRSLPAQILRPSPCQKGSRKRRLKILPESSRGRSRPISMMRGTL